MTDSPNVGRRRFLRAGLEGLATVPLLGLAGRAAYAQAPAPTARTLTGRITLISGVPGNVLALSADEGLLLVDSGAAEFTRALTERLGGAAVHTVINTHYHADQTGGNVHFGEAGATIRAHEITRQWLSSDYYVPAEDRWVPALPSAGRPAETFRGKIELAAGAERIECGYLLEAHTRGDIYVFFHDSNVLAVGDVASPLRDPSHDWYAGGWLGGRVDALDDLLEVANDDTLIVPAYGPVMSRAELKAERDMMWHLYERTSTLVNAGRDAEDLLEAGVLDEVDRKFEDPYRFLYDVAKGLWAHYTNFGGNVV